MSIDDYAILLQRVAPQPFIAPKATYSVDVFPTVNPFTAQTALPVHAELVLGLKQQQIPHGYKTAPETQQPMSVTVLEPFIAKTSCPTPVVPPGLALYDSFTPAISASEYLGLAIF